MPTKEEILDESKAKASELKEFAKEHGVDVTGMRKRSEIVEALVETRKVSKQEIEDRFGQDQGQDAEGNLPQEEEGSGDPADRGTEDGTVGRGERTPPNVRAMTALKERRGPEVSGDPALTGDLAENAKARVEGRTSDPNTRQEGTTAAEVGPDINEGPKQSDAGPDRYPFPPQGDVDVSLVDPGNGQDEDLPLLNVDDWVILDGAHEDVPDRLDGHMAYIVDAPTVLCNCDFAPRTHEHLAPDAAITVKTRDEVNATLYLPLEAFKQIGRGGRSAVSPVG